MVPIRTATPDDAAEMARIRTDSMRQRGADAYSERQLQYLAPDPDGEQIPDSAFRDADTHVIVVEHDGEIVG